MAVRLLLFLLSKTFKLQNTLFTDYISSNNVWRYGKNLFCGSEKFKPSTVSHDFYTV